jgi:hypothetical protein
MKYGSALQITKGSPLIRSTRSLCPHCLQSQTGRNLLLQTPPVWQRQLDQCWSAKGMIMQALVAAAYMPPVHTFPLLLVAPIQDRPAILH